MFKIQSIAARLILAISLTVAAACGILGSFSIIQQRSLTRLALEQQLKLQYDSVIAAVDYEGRTALAISSVIAALPPVAEAIAKGDREAIAALLGGAMTSLKAQGIPLITFWTPPALSFYRVHEPKIFGDDASKRRETVVEANRTGKQVVGVEASRVSLGIFGMTPIQRDGKSLANVDVGAAFGDEFVERAKQRFGIDLAVHWHDGNDFKKLSSTFVDDQVVVGQDELKQAFNGASLHRDAALAGHPAALYLGQIRNYAGKPIAVPQVGWNGRRFTDTDEMPIRVMSKLYPWEWMVREEFGAHVLTDTTAFIEPAWKMILSNKMLLPLLWEGFPGHANLLPAFDTDDIT